MKNDDKTVKLVAETIKAGMTKFVGEVHDEKETKKVLIENMTNVLSQFGILADIPPQLPKIEVTLNGTEATFTFRDPKTDEPIDVATWASRASEGFYDH